MSEWQKNIWNFHTVCHSVNQFVVIKTLFLQNFSKKMVKKFPQCFMIDINNLTYRMKIVVGISNSAWTVPQLRPRNPDGSIAHVFMVSVRLCLSQGLLHYFSSKIYLVILDLVTWPILYLLCNVCTRIQSTICNKNSKSKDWQEWEVKTFVK